MSEAWDHREHPLIAGHPCPKCRSERVRLATTTRYFYYVRCEQCAHVWSNPERRSSMSVHHPTRRATDLG